MKHKYEIVASDIQEIIDQTLSPHDPLPSERELMTIYEVGRMTVRAAVSKLVTEGRVYNIHGSGTYVGTTTMTSFTEDMVSRRYAVSSKTLVLERIKATERIAEHLDISAGSSYLHLRRLRLADDHPMAIEDVYSPGDVIELESLQLDRSHYEQLSHSGHEVHRAAREITALPPSGESCKFLGVPKGSAALQVQRASTTRRGQPIESASTLYRADRYSLQIAVTKEGLD